MSSTPSELCTQLLGTLLDARYRLDECVGHGGMGAVFRATDLRLERPVAVKVMLPETAAGRGRQRFTREARLAARIQHPNVVTVHDFGTDEEPGTGRALDYIVMELLRGECLADMLPRLSRAELALAADILAQAARGVGAGHRAGIVHRDVKPRNLFVVPGEPPERVLVRVVDFGIAKSHTSAAEFGEITVGNGFMGSARYASPEQLQERGEPGPPSDVFSLGLVGYELLAGAPPFTEGDRTRLSQALYVPVRAPSLLNRAIPGPVEKVILRCLELDPAKRFPHADALAAALDEAWRAAPAPAWTAPPLDATAVAGDQTQADATLLQLGADPFAGLASADVPAAADLPAAAVPPAAVPLPAVAAADAAPAGAVEERRQATSAPRPDRWRPGVGAAVAVLALVAVFVAGALAGVTSDGSWRSTLTAFFSRAPRDLVAGAPLAGVLGRGDSVLAPGLRFDVYRFRGEAGEPLVLALESPEFEGAIEWGRVVGGAWRALESSDRSRPAKIAVTVADTGEYRVRVRALNPGAQGSYTLRAVRGLRTLTPAEPVASRLGPADAGLADGVWYEEWSLLAAPGQQLNVSVHPDTFSARLEWWRPAAGRWERMEEATSDDPGEDAQLTATPSETGEVRVRVRNRREREGGVYTLRVTTGPRELQPGGEARVSRLSGADAGSVGGTAGEVWAYRGPVGEPVALSVRSSTLHTVLEWGRFTEGRWQSFASTSDSSAALRVRPPATGEYFVRVRPVRQGEAGRYRLLATAEAPPAGVVTPGRGVQGTLAQGDPDEDGRYYEEWSFSGTPGERISMALQSGQFDPVLIFGCWTAEGVWQEVARNDDAWGPRNRDALLVTRVGGTGECRVRARSYYRPGESDAFAGAGGYGLAVSTANDSGPRM